MNCLDTPDSEGCVKAGSDGGNEGSGMPPGWIADQYYVGGYYNGDTYYERSDGDISTHQDALQLQGDLLYSRCAIDAPWRGIWCH
jgi:hypothetical protein